MSSKSNLVKNWTYVLLACAWAFSGTLLAQRAEKPKRNLLFIGQAKGYQHEATSTAMATLYNLGRSSGLWNTQLRTDCTAITKKPLKWEAKNLDAFDAIVFFTDGDLDMDASQKADLLSFDLTRKGVKRADKDFAVIWARNYGKGRVLYNGLGHAPAVWERSDFQKMWLEMVQWSLGLIPGDAKPLSKPEK